MLAEAELVAEGAGPAPCAYAVLVLGSAGRGESLLAMDQDNALVFAEGEPDGEADRWFARLGRRMAAILGINTDRVISLVFVIGAAMAGLAGVLVTMNYGTFDFYIGFIIGIKAFTAAVLGGIGSLPGAMLGGLLLGVAEAQFAGLVNSDYKDVFSFALLVAILIFRPQGLLGRPLVAKV